LGFIERRAEPSNHGLIGSIDNQNDKGEADELPLLKCIGAGNETRTRDLNLGKVALYQLSYSRIDAYRLEARPGVEPG
jgi:hypothetical protein